MTTETPKRRRTPRSERGKRAVQPTPAYIKRVLPFFDPLDEEQLTKIEGMADWLIQEKGIAFKDDPIALDIWRAAGADVDADCNVRLPAGVARQLCQTIPSEFTQVARNPAKTVSRTLTLPNFYVLQIFMYKCLFGVPGALSESRPRHEHSHRTQQLQR